MPVADTLRFQSVAEAKTYATVWFLANLIYFTLVSHNRVTEIDYFEYTSMRRSRWKKGKRLFDNYRDVLYSCINKTEGWRATWIRWKRQSGNKDHY
jgi:hypothetical protein